MSFLRLSFILLILGLPFLAIAETDGLRIRSVMVRGERAIPEEKLRQILGVRSGDRFSERICPRVTNRITRRYERIGYSQIQVNCDYTQIGESIQLEVRITEGPPSRIKDVVFAEDLPVDIKNIVNPVFKEMRGKVLSPQSKRDWTKKILFSLRSEGYLYASAQIDDAEGALSVSIIPKGRVELRLIGNKHYSSEQLVQLLDLDDRLSPFTNRGIAELSELITQFYEAQGYFLCRVETHALGEIEGKTVYEFEITEGDQIFISSIEIQGNEAISSKEIKSVIKLKPRASWPLGDLRKGIATRPLIAQDIVSIEELYRSYGYLDVKVGIIPEFNFEAHRIRLIFEVQEGILSSIEQVETSSSCSEGDAVLELFRDLKGRAIKDSLVAEAKSKALSQLYSGGLADAVLKAEFHPETKTLKASVSCGQKVVVRSIEFRGMKYADKNFIQNLLDIREGDLWNPNVVKEAGKRLRSTGLFSSVDLQPMDGNLDSPEEDLLVSVTERDTGVVDRSISFNTEDGLRLGGELSQRNLRGMGETLSLTADVFLNNEEKLFDAGRARAFYKVPRIFGLDSTDLLSEGYFQYDIQTVNEFTFSRVGVDAQLRHTIESVILSGGVSLFQDDVSDVEPDVFLTSRDSGNTKYAFLTGKIEYDARDSSLLPTDGFYASMLGKLSSEAVLGDVSIAVGSLELKHYLSLTDEVVWANGARGTILEPFSDTDVVPITQRLFLGGNRTLRGFGRNKLSPMGTADHRSGGDRDYVLNSELQLNLPSDIQFALFADAGEVDITNGGDELESTSTGFRTSVGFGLRYRSPIGPLGLDLGFPVDRRPGESSPRIYFGFNGIF